MLQQLKDRYSQYVREAEAARANAPVLAGLLGLSGDPRKDPCHMAFYRDAEQWVKELLAACPAEEQAFEAVQFILMESANHRQEDVYWFMFAAHGLCREMIGMLSKAHCAALAERYDKEYPRRERMAAQAEVYKALARGARGK